MISSVIYPLDKIPSHLSSLVEKSSHYGAWRYEVTPLWGEDKPRGRIIVTDGMFVVAFW